MNSQNKDFVRENYLKVILPDNTVIYQDKEGQKVSSDNQLFTGTVLEKLAKYKDNECSLLDIGTGNGINIFMVAKTFKKWHFTGIDIDDKQVLLAQNNMIIQNVNCSFYHHDLKGLEVNEKFDFIISNPPYRKVGNSRLGKSYRSNIAKFEIEANMDDLFSCIARNLSGSGQAWVMYPKERLEEVKSISKQNNLDVIEIISKLKIILIGVQHARN